MLTDILIASPAEAPTILEQYPRHKQWPSLELKGLDNAKLAALLVALGLPAEATALEGEECLAASHKDGPWVFVLPVALRDVLAALPDSELGAIAKRWAEQEELAFDSWSPEDVEPCIGMLKGHAMQGSESAKDLLLWMAL